MGSVLSSSNKKKKDETELGSHTSDDRSNDAPLPQKETDVVKKNDFIIRDGFPVLYLPTGHPNIDDAEPLPRHLFWSVDDALNTSPDVWDTLRQDCMMVFTARTRDSENEAYSAGITYFLPCAMKPRCVLEQLVQSIFQLHTKDLNPATFIPEQSGAEWWTLVLNDSEPMGTSESVEDAELDEEDEEDDDVGLHFDADYGLEAQIPNLLVHPRVATVTYLSDYGSPTVVFAKSSPSSQTNVQERSPTRSLVSPITQAWLSHPNVGKHIAFDGRLLHGAPSTFFPAIESKNGAYLVGDGENSLVNTNDVESEPPRKKPKITELAVNVRPEIVNSLQPPQRITLLVNIWLNHCPMDAEPLEESMIESLETPWNPQEEPLCSWTSNVHLDVTTKCPSVELKAATEAAGIDEIVLCNRYVTVTYGASMEDFHKSSTATSSSNVELQFGPDAFKIEVGEEVSSDDENEDEEDDEGKA
jgi:hypothetical protein